MPRDASGNYTLASGNPVVPLTPIESTWANDTLSDLADALTQSLDRLGRGSMQSQLKLASGTAATPGMAFSAEVNSGLYRAGSHDIRMSVNGVDITKFLSTDGVRFLYSGEGSQISVARTGVSPLGRIAMSSTGVFNAAWGARRNAAGDNWIAEETTSGVVSMSGSSLRWSASTGNVIGSAPTFTEWFKVDNTGIYFNGVQVMTTAGGTFTSLNVAGALTVGGLATLNASANVVGNINLQAASAGVGTQITLKDSGGTSKAYLQWDNATNSTYLGNTAAGGLFVNSEALFHNTATGYFRPASGTTAQRPGSPVTGATRFNTSTSDLEVYGGASVGWLGMVPPGMIMAWLTAVGLPSGWAALSGQAISRTANPILFARLGTTYGVGDGSTTFNLPNAGGRAAFGVGTPDGNITSFLPANVNVAANSITTQYPYFFNGMRVRLSNSGGGLPAPLVAGTDYYVIRSAGTAEIFLATTRAAAQAGIPIDITTQGTGTHTIQQQDVVGIGETQAGGTTTYWPTLGELYNHNHNVIIDGAGVNGVQGGGTAGEVQVNKTAAQGGSEAMDRIPPFFAIYWVIKLG